jgi:hypothetical protein
MFVPGQEMAREIVAVLYAGAARFGSDSFFAAGALAKPEASLLPCRAFIFEGAAFLGGTFGHGREVAASSGALVVA